MMCQLTKAVLLAMVFALLIACSPEPEGTSALELSGEKVAQKRAEVVVYSARKEHLIKPLFDRYTEITDVPVSYVTDSAGPLLARLLAEGEQAQADLLMTVDAGNLWRAAEQGVLRSLTSEVLTANVPKNLRDVENRWFGLSVRARTIVYSSDRVTPEELSSYEALGEDQWRGRLCLRTAKKVYNQSLVATLIAAHGEQAAEEFVKGWVANLALAPFSNDTKVMEAIIAEQCDIGIVNTYYFARLKNKNPEAALAIFWPNQSGEAALGRGVHINISGAGVTSAASNPEGAQALLEWLASEEAQQIFAALNHERPVHPDIPPSAEVTAWGEFKADAIDVAEAGRRQAAAIMLMDRASYH
jgi:iron(III) transport system substrate-binding protein